MIIKGWPLPTWSGKYSQISFPLNMGCLWYLLWSIQCDRNDVLEFSRPDVQTNWQFLFPLQGRQPSYYKVAWVTLVKCLGIMWKWRGHAEIPKGLAMWMKPSWTSLFCLLNSADRGTSANDTWSRTAWKNFLDFTRNWWEARNHCCFKSIKFGGFFFFFL